MRTFKFMLFVLLVLVSFTFLMGSAFTAQEGENTPQEVLIFNKGCHKENQSGPVKCQDCRGKRQQDKALQ